MPFPLGKVAGEAANSESSLRIEVDGSTLYVLIVDQDESYFLLRVSITLLPWFPIKETSQVSPPAGKRVKSVFSYCPRHLYIALYIGTIILLIIFRTIILKGVVE